MLNGMVDSIIEESKRLLTNKLIWIILFVMPIAANLLIGFEFQGNQIQHIPMAIVDEDQSSLSRMVIQQFEQSDTFSVKLVTDSEETLKNIFEQGKIKTGMVIPPHFSQDVAKLKAPSILMLYDGSQMSVASTAKSKASEILLTLKTGVSMKMVGGKMNLAADPAEKTARLIKFDSRFLYNPGRSYKLFLNPGLGVAIVQTAIVLLGAVCIKRESLPGGLGQKLGYITGKIGFYTVLGTFSFLSSVLIQNMFFDIPFTSSVKTLVILSLLMALAITAFAVMISVWITDTSLASLVVAAFFIPSAALGGYTWPVMAMPKLYKAIAYIMPYSHYGSQLRDLYLKGVPSYLLLSDMEFLLCFALVSFIAAAVRLVFMELPAFATLTARLKEEY